MNTKSPSTLADKLKPCPFCGEPPIPGLFEADDVGGWFVSSGICQVWGATPEEAIAAWNKRASLELAVWQPIETAPKDGTKILAACFDPPWAESHLRGDIQACWWQPEFDGFITSCQQTTLRHDLKFENGAQSQLHSPQYARYRSHWIPLPAAPDQAEAESA